MLRLHVSLVLHNESGAYQTCSYVSMNRLQCDRRKGKSPLSISSKHEFKWYSANGCTLKILILRRTYPSYNLCSASTSHFLKSRQTYSMKHLSHG